MCDFLCKYNRLVIAHVLAIIAILALSGRIFFYYTVELSTIYYILPCDGYSRTNPPGIFLARFNLLGMIL